MHIKSVTLSNFRSFKQQPEIHPFSPEMNCVVGRNGSGKSNLFDAVQFVLGCPKFWSLRTVSCLDGCVQLLSALFACLLPVWPNFCVVQHVRCSLRKRVPVLTVHLCFFWGGARVIHHDNVVEGILLPVSPPV